MGLESVELIMDLEEIFNMTIPDSETEIFYTVGDLQQCLIARLDS